MFFRTAWALVAVDTTLALLEVDGFPCTTALL